MDGLTLLGGATLVEPKKRKSKRHRDLQWRLLHGIMVVNAFVSIIKTTVEDKCPFCNVKETIFHCFYECHRLSDLIIFTSFKEVFINGFKYTRQEKHKSQLLNIVLGQAKMVMYITRKRRTSTLSRSLSVNMIRSRLLVDFTLPPCMLGVCERV